MSQGSYAPPYFKWHSYLVAIGYLFGIFRLELALSDVPHYDASFEYLPIPLWASRVNFDAWQAIGSTLTHILTGVDVVPETTEVQAKDTSFLRLTFPGRHTIDVNASMDLELQLAEDAAHDLHLVGEGSGEIHKRAAQRWEHLSRKHNLDE